MQGRAYVPQSFDDYWMPFTDNARFKAAPKFIGQAFEVQASTPEEPAAYTVQASGLPLE